MNKEWWQNIDPKIHISLAEARNESTLEEVNFIIEHCKCVPGKKILDLACGDGRHAKELATRELTVYGLDYNYKLLEFGKKSEREVNFTQGNMLELPFGDGSFDIAISMWNSIGYFRDESDNEQVFSEVSRVLTPGGYLVLQVNNPYKLILDIVSKSKIDEQGRSYLQTSEFIGQDKIKKIAVFNPKTSRYLSRRVNLDEKGNEVLFAEHDMRYYFPTELIGLLNDNQMETVSIYGSVDDRIYAIDSNDLIIVSRKKI